MSWNQEIEINREKPDRDFFKGKKEIVSGEGLFGEIENILANNGKPDLTMQDINTRLQYSKRALGGKVAILLDGESVGWIRGKEKAASALEYVTHQLWHKEWLSLDIQKDTSNKLISLKTKTDIHSLREWIDTISHAKNMAEQQRQELLQQIKDRKSEKGNQDRSGRKSFRQFIHEAEDQVKILDDTISFLNRRSTKINGKGFDMSMARVIHAKLAFNQELQKAFGVATGLILTTEWNQFGVVWWWVWGGIENWQYNPNAGLNTAVSNACIKARYASMEEAFRVWWVAWAIWHWLDSWLQALWIQNQMSDRQKLNAQKFLWLWLTIGAWRLGLEYVRNMFSWTKDGKVDRSTRWFNPWLAAGAGAGLLAYQMFAGEKGYKQAWGELINYFFGEWKTNSLESSRPGYAFVDAPAKQKAEDFIKQNKDKYKDEYFKTYFEQQNRLKSSNASNTDTNKTKTEENQANKENSKPETYRDGIDRGNFWPKLSQIETSIKASNNPENLKRYESIKPDLLRELNALYTQHPDAHPISIDFDGSTFSIGSYGNITKLDIRNKQSITLVNSINGSGRSSRMNSISESIRMANLTNHLMNNFKGKAPENTISSNYPFYISSTSGSLSFASTGGVLWYATDTEVLKDEWIGGDFERNFPTLNAEKSANRWHSPFGERLNRMNIWYGGGYDVLWPTKIDGYKNTEVIKNEQELRENIAKKLNKSPDSTEVQSVIDLWKYLQKAKELGLTTGNYFIENGKILIETTKWNLIELWVFIEKNKDKAWLIVWNSLWRSVNTLLSGVWRTAQALWQNGANVFTWFFEYFGFKDINLWWLRDFLQKAKEQWYTTGKRIIQNGKIMIENIWWWFTELWEFIEKHKWEPWLRVWKKIWQWVYGTLYGIWRLASLPVETWKNIIRWIWEWSWINDYFGINQ